MGWEDGGGAGGLVAATVKSGSVRELGSSSTANPRLNVEAMKTKCLPKNPALTNFESTSSLSPPVTITGVNLRDDSS